jgi:protein-S-isoprenylcysteine O-methyltransferase Ste14
VLVVVWVIGAFKAKRTARRESLLSRFGAGAVAIVEYFALLWIAQYFGAAHHRFLADSQSYLWVGMLMTMAGVAFAIWARLILGRNWSGMVTVKQDHELIRRGPYALVRHPIYTGIAFAGIGTAIFYGEISGLIVIVAMLSVLLHKMKVEERFMTEQFGSAYTDYQEKTKAFLPLVW